MSTENVPVFSRYQGNGIATEFSVTFPYLDKKYVKVYLKRKDSAVEEKLADNRYSFTNDKVIRFPVLSSDPILSEGDILTIQRETELGSNYEFDNQRRLFPVAAMNADDLGFQQIQELARDVARSVKVSPTGTDTPDEMWQRFESDVKRTEINAVNADKSAKDAADSATHVDEVSAGFDARVEGATNDFNRNYNDKLEAFNNNSVNKQNDFDTNAATLTARYDNNDLAKTKAFNENAQAMTDGYNANALLKIDDFDAHAMTKEMEFDDNAATKQAQVDASAAKAMESETNAKDSETKAKASEDKCIELVNSLQNVYKFKGSVPTKADLPTTGNTTGDVWNVLDSDINYAWDGTAWDALGGASTDLSDYVTKDLGMLLARDEEVNSSKTFLKDQAIKSPDLDIRTDRSKRGNGLIFTDKNGTQTAGIGVYVNNNQSPECRLVASNGTQSAFAGLGVTTDGQGFFEVPTPKEGSNNRDAVNSEWVHKELTTHYVDKKGDTMIGALNFGTSGYIEANKANSTKGLALFGSIDGYGQGASIALRDNTADGAQAGVFKLETGNNVTGHTHTLQGNPDGTIRWDGKELANVDLNNLSQTGKDVIKANSGVPANADYVVESQTNSDGSWYRKYKSGWLEQGGYITKSGVNYLEGTEPLLRPYKNKDYGIFITCSGGTTAYTPKIQGRTTTNFGYSYIENIDGGANWKASGQGA